jgi:hypothetical protein
MDFKQEYDKYTRIYTFTVRIGGQTFFLRVTGEYMAAAPDWKAMVKSEFMALFSKEFDKAIESVVIDKPKSTWDYVPPQPSYDASWGSGVDGDLAELCPALLRHRVVCPVADCLYYEYAKYPNRLTSVIQHLNDGHKYTREEIADWLETLDVDIQLQPKEQTC